MKTSSIGSYSLKIIVDPVTEFALLVKITLNQRCINVSQRHINNSQQLCDSYARMVPAAAKRLLSATITLSFKVEDPIFRNIKWYQSLVRSFDQEKHNIQAQQKKKMVKTSSSSENEPCCSKACKKNTEILNSKITDLTDKLFDAKNMIFHYKLGLAQVESRLAEHRDRELKYCEKIRGLKFKTESSDDYIKILKKKLELIKKEKEGLDSKLTCFQTASKDLDSLLESQRLDKNKEGLGYSVVPPPPAQIYSPSKKDMSWTDLSEFKDDIVTDYSRHAPTVESSLDDAQNRNPSIIETEASPSTISPKSFIKFVKAADRPTEDKTDKNETAKKPTVKNIELYRRTSKSFKRVKMLEKELKARTSPTKVHKVDRGRSRPVMAWVPRRSDFLKGNSGAKLKYAVRTKRSRGVVDYILQVKKNVLTKKLDCRCSIKFRGGLLGLRSI
nr:hypothetical protein [Tanacetum cinerariifolium]